MARLCKIVPLEKGIDLLTEAIRLRNVDDMRDDPQRHIVTTSDYTNARESFESTDSPFNESTADGVQPESSFTAEERGQGRSRTFQYASE